MLVIAFSGRIGSGKTAVSKRVSEELQWPRVSFGDYVRLVVRQRGMQETRKNLQQVGTSLLESDPLQFCSSVLAMSDWQRSEGLVIDGLRHLRTIEIIRDLIAPAELKIIYLAVTDETRIARLSQRDPAEPTVLSNVEMHSSEQEIGLISNVADFVLNGEDALAAATQDVIRWIKTQQ